MIGAWFDFWMGTLRESFLHRVGRGLSFFSSRRNWDYPIPSPAGNCAPPPPLVPGGRAHSLAAKKAEESQFRRRDIYCGTLYIYAFCASVGHIRFQWKATANIYSTTKNLQKVLKKTKLMQPCQDSTRESLAQCPIEVPAISSDSKKLPANEEDFATQAAVRNGSVRH
jgi:hypothetical protein